MAKNYSGKLHKCFIDSRLKKIQLDAISAELEIKNFINSQPGEVTSVKCENNLVKGYTSAECLTSLSGFDSVACGTINRHRGEYVISVTIKICVFHLNFTFWKLTQNSESGGENCDKIVYSINDIEKIKNCLENSGFSNLRSERHEAKNATVIYTVILYFLNLIYILDLYPYWHKSLSC